MKHLTEEQALRQIEELQAHVESVRKEKKKQHFPHEDDDYYAPDLTYEVTATMDDTSDYFYIFTNSAHRDRASADKHMEIIRYMVDLAREEEPLDWGDRDQQKYFIEWSHDLERPKSQYFCAIQNQGTFYLPSDAACQKVIGKFGDDLRVLFGMGLREG